MPLFNYSIETRVNVSAQFISSAPSPDLAIKEAELAQSRGAINWERSGIKIGPIFEPFKSWASKNSDGSYTVSLSSEIFIVSTGSAVSGSSEDLRESILALQSSGSLEWKYRDVPVGPFNSSINLNLWSNEAVPFPTSTSLVIDPATTFPGFSVSLTATVLSEFEPEGLVQFKNGEDIIASSVVSGGQAQFISSFVAGEYEITANFLGSDQFDSSSSTPESLLVEQVDTITSFSVNNSTYATVPRVFEFTVTGSPSNPPGISPSGVLELRNGVSVLGTANIVNGEGTLTLNTLNPSSYNLVAVYLGSSVFGSSISSTLPLTVVSTPTTVNFSITQDVPNTFFLYSEPLTFDAEVLVPVGAELFGTIDFINNGSVIIESASIDNNGHAIITVDDINFDLDTTAKIDDPPLFAITTSSNQVLPFNLANFSMSISRNPVTPLVAGELVTFTVTSSVVSPATKKPSDVYPTADSRRNVVFQDFAVGIGTVPFLDNGTVSLVSGILTAGTHSINAQYTGTTEFGSTGATLASLVIGKANVTQSAIFTPSTGNTLTVFNIEVRVFPASPSSGQLLPTGQVKVKLPGPDANLTLISGPGYSYANHTIPASTFSVGVNNIDLEFNGDSNFNPQTTVVQLVVS